MSITQTLINLNLEPDSLVTLVYSEGADVFVHNETEVETAMAETDVISTFSELIAIPGLHVSTQFGGNVLDRLREDDLLDDYDRDGDFGAYLNDVISDNFYDLELIEHTTEKYDHKRGFCTLTAEVQIPVSQIISEMPYLSGWRASVPTKDGTLMFDA
jgi:hypothetical protein|tara:strand:+ start:974 stop:1447 length:474 start_codon:yes stop_codon:yes gene_type:complete